MERSKAPTAMKHIRIGKDIRLQWTINTGGAAIPLEGRDLTLEMKSPIGKVISIPYRVDGNVLTMTYYGKEQTVVGEYSLTLWENKGKQGQNVVDAIRAFKLVRTSPEEADFIGGDLQVESVDLGTANLEILSGGGAATPGESPDLSALEGKVAANTASISNINAELGNVKQEQTEQNNSIAHINTTIEEHSERIHQLESSTPGGDSDAITQINSTLQEIKTEQTEQNNRLADHEERLVYTEGDLVKVREEYNSIISELVKSIGHTQKAFVVETNDSEGDVTIDGVKMIIPANSIKGFMFQKAFSSHSPGIASFRFFVTNTSVFTSMGYMFQGCSSLTSIDVSGFDTSAVTNMSAVFWGCSSLTSLDLSNFDTSAVTSMAYMFINCSSLTSIDVSGFDTSAVTLMESIFRGCSSLTSLDLSNFDTSAVINMTYMFGGTSALTSLLLGPNFFKTSEVTIIDFYSCSKWTNETVITSLVTNSYDRAAAGLNTLTLQLHANTKAALSDEQKATITNKGYTIA